jgi:hypothetical protein
MSLRRRILGSRLRGWTDQRDRERFGLRSVFGGRPCRSRAKLEALVHDLIERTIDPCKGPRLKDAGLPPSDIALRPIELPIVRCMLPFPNAAQVQLPRPAYTAFDGSFRAREVARNSRGESLIEARTLPLRTNHGLDDRQERNHAHVRLITRRIVSLQCEAPRHRSERRVQFGAYDGPFANCGTDPLDRSGAHIAASE